MAGAKSLLNSLFTWWEENACGDNLFQEYSSKDFFIAIAAESFLRGNGSLVWNIQNICSTYGGIFFLFFSCWDPILGDQLKRYVTGPKQLPIMFSSNHILQQKVALPLKRFLWTPDDPIAKINNSNSKSSLGVLWVLWMWIRWPTNLTKLNKQY